MADRTKIEWTDATWNPITGCAVVSPGCTNCYAMKLAGTRLRHIPSRAGLTRDTKAGPVWTGEIRFNAEWLDQPLRWRRPRMIFVCAHGDLFAEGVTDEMLDQVFAVMALAPRHTFQVLTKRPERMRAYCSDIWAPERIWAAVQRIGALHIEHLSDLIWSGGEITRWAVANTERTIFEGEPFRPILGRKALGWPLPNVWLGVSAEDQRHADERVPQLLVTPAAVRWVSAEPLLGPIDFRFLQPSDPPVEIDAVNGTHGVLRPHGGKSAHLDWIVAGGESGRGARPMHPDWVRSIRDQCAEAGVAFLFKQWGEHEPDEIGPEDTRSIQFPPHHVIFRKVGKKAAGRRLDGVQHDGYPLAEEIIF